MKSRRHKVCNKVYNKVCDNTREGVGEAEFLRGRSSSAMVAAKSSSVDSRGISGTCMLLQSWLESRQEGCPIAAGMR